MADRQLVLNDVLCFLVNKYVRMPVKQLKSAVLDFYSIESIAEAKVRLLDDVKLLNTGVKFPHKPLRHEGDGRMAREADDLFTLLQLLDEHKLFDSLPYYVCGNPDNIPSARLFEGDMNVLLVMLEKVQRKVEEYGSALTTITRDVSQLQSKFVTLSQARSTLDDQFPPLPSAPAKPRPPRSQQQQQPQQPALQPPVGNSVVDTVASADIGVPDWATLSSTPNAQTNRFSVLASTTDDDDGSEPYEQVQSRKGKRLRSGTHQQSQYRQQQQQQTNKEKPDQRPPRPRPSILGKSTATTNIAAARKLRRKAVFCIDNVDPSYSTDDIKSFVSSLSIDVISVFEVKPRRRRIDFVRRAFRLCIFHEDRERLKVDTKWPDSVIISDWFFKSESEQGNQLERNKKLRLDVMEAAASGSSGAAAAAAIVEDPVADPAGESIDDCSMTPGDDTIIAAYDANNVGCVTSVDYGN